MNALTTAAQRHPAPATLALMDPAQFDQMQRVGKMLALSPLFPEHLRKGTQDERIANGVLVMNMAVRLREDPLTVAQNIYFVSGRPGWNTTYMIAKANMHGVFKNPIDWEVSGKGTDNLSVTAFAELSGTGKRVEMTADMAMAQAEGWTKNPKYKSIPETMLRYRSAAALIRLYCPEVMIGLPVGIEIETEMRDVTPPSERSEPVGMEAARAVINNRAGKTVGGEIVDEETGEVTQIEDRRAAQQTMPQEREKAEPTPVARRQSKPRTDGTPYTEGGAKQGELVAQDADKAGGDDERPEDFGRFVDHIDRTISDELNDGASLAEVMDLYDAQLAKIKKFAPTEYARMVKSYEDFSRGGSAEQD